MGYPADATQVTLSGLFSASLPGASIPTGTVAFWPNTVLADAGTGQIIEAATVTASLDGTGAFSVTLMATDDPDIHPAGWAYWVRETIDGYPQRIYQVKLPAPGPYRLGDLQQLSAPATSPYVLQSQVGQPNGVASLDAAGQVPASQLANASGGGGGGGVPSSTVVTETGYGQASMAGVAATYSRGDHTHGSPSLASTSPTSSAAGDATAVGTSTTPARADHRHGRESFGTPGSSAVGDAPSAGVAATVAHSDHVHGRESAGTPGSSAVGDTAAAGSSASIALADHRHGREGFGAVTAQIAFAAASANGSAATLARSDHAHGTPPLPYAELVFSVPGAVAAVTGTARVYIDSGRALTIQAVRASVGTAPTGAALIVDIKKNGVTIFTTQANRPTIAISANTSGKVTNMDVTALADGDYFTVDVAQVGSTIAGSDLTVQIWAAG